MKLLKFIHNIGLVLLGGLVFSLGVLAQDATPNPTAEATPTPQKRERLAKTEADDTVKTEDKLRPKRRFLTTNVRNRRPKKKPRFCRITTII